MSAHSMPKPKALFLDRDGVVNVDHGYVSKPQDFEFIDGVFSACQRFQQAGYKIVIVTNQSGIGRGYYSEADFNQLTEWMVQAFKSHQVDISAVYFCPHHPTNAKPEYLQECDCRKPEPGMLLQAIAEFGIDPNSSIMVGDKSSDMLAAASAGIGNKYLVKSGQCFAKQVEKLADGVFDDLASVAESLLS